MVAEDALRIYTRTVRAKLTLGRSIDTLLAASVYASLRVHSLTRALDEIVDLADSNRKNVVKAYRLVLTHILPQLHVKPHPFGPVRFVDKIIGDIQASMDVRNAAVKLLTDAKKNGLRIGGKDPKGFAGAAIYVAGIEIGEPLTQGDIAKYARITEVTLRARIKEIKHFRDL
jgi:transcription initiation factor TFIIB